jgi:hypothetical protein
MVHGHRNQNGDSCRASPDWLGVRDLCRILGLCRRTIYNRRHAGSYIVRGGTVWVRSLSHDEQKLVREAQFRQAAEAGKPLSPAVSEPSGQLELLPKTEEERRIEEQLARLDPAQRPAVLARFGVVKPGLNHDYRALGYPRLGSYVEQVALQIGVSKQTWYRWRGRYLKSGDICSLAFERPGPPAAGFGSIALDASMRAHIQHCWEVLKLTRTQTYRSLTGYLRDKQRGCGPAYVYRFPSRPTVIRYINVELRGDKNPWRRGADAVKAWAGHADRTYRDLPSLGQVECDEWNTNNFAFEACKADRVLRYWLIELHDTRSTCPLVWDLVGAADGVKRLHGISQRDEHRLFVRLVTEFGVPQNFYSDRGRFRGSLWGGEPGARARRRDQEFARSDGIFESLDIKRRTPREHNPRGSRLERFHLFLSDKCRELPGWVGATEDERAMAPGDRQAAEHMEFVAGRRLTTPLLTKEQLLEKIDGWMEEWRAHASDGTDMDGLSPRAVFLRNMPEGGFRQLTAPEMELLSAEWYPNRKISAGGIIELPDGRRYGLPGELTGLQGTKRNIVRMPSEKALILVKGLRKGEADIVAHLRPRLGMGDSNLGAWIESERSVRKIGEARLEEPSPESNTAEILEPYRAPEPARRERRIAADIARDAKTAEAGQ